MANPCFSVILSQKSANVAHYNKGTKETTKEDFPMSAININKDNFCIEQISLLIFLL